MRCTWEIKAACFGQGKSGIKLITLPTCQKEGKTPGAYPFHLELFLSSTLPQQQQQQEGGKETNKLLIRKISRAARRRRWGVVFRDEPPKPHFGDQRNTKPGPSHCRLVSFKLAASFSFFLFFLLCCCLVDPACFGSISRTRETVFVLVKNLVAFKLP